MHGIDDGPIYRNIGVTSSALAVQMFGNAQDLQQQNVWYDDGPIHCNIPLTASALVVHILHITIAWTLRAKPCCSHWFLVKCKCFPVQLAEEFVEFAATGPRLGNSQSANDSMSRNHCKPLVSAQVVPPSWLETSAHMDQTVKFIRIMLMLL